MSALTIGVVGGGQLGRMLALAGYPLGLRFRVLDPAEDACAGQVAIQIRAGYDDSSALAELAAQCDVATFEFENVPSDAVAGLAGDVPAFPPANALAIAQDRLLEKRLFREVALDTAPFFPVSTRDELDASVDEVKGPAVLKTRRSGYDGKGQCLIKRPQDVSAAWDRIGGVPLLLEGFVHFEREVSLIAARSRGGEMAFYPLVENIHREGVLRVSRVIREPALQQRAQEVVGALLERLEYVGVVALEFFVVQGRLLGNEIAPRVHNSGHWSIEGAVTSQFENHLRAILDWPLGSTDVGGHVAMVNVLGDMPNKGELLKLPGVHVHDYGKKAAPRRKVGHITIVAEDAVSLERLLPRVLQIVDGG